MDNIVQHLKGDTGRLAATYLAIIFGLTLIFSSVIYSISTSQFNRPLPPRAESSRIYNFDDFTRSSVQQFVEDRAAQARDELLLSLVVLNVVVVAGGAVFSYYLARKTLEPIEAAMESQSQFVSDASHELRTPLTALQVTNEVALRKKKLTMAEAKDLIGHNLAETVKLHTLTDSLLGLANQKAADITKSDLNVAEVILDVVQTLSPLAESKRMTIAHEIPAVHVTANQAALSQILRILLDNAIKYSPDGSTVTLSVTTDHNVVISIADQGPGIAPEFQSKIFDRFYRIDESRSSNHVEGNGLGLSIAKTIADRHRYRIQLSSQKSKGSTFSVIIPA
jgi:two-component system sensor histidine kinase CiaH